MGMKWIITRKHSIQNWHDDNRSVLIAHQVSQALSCCRDPFVNGLVAVGMSYGLPNQGGKLPLGQLLFLEHHTSDDDSVNDVKLGQTIVNLLFENAVSDILLHAIWIPDFLARMFQCTRVNQTAAALIWAATTVAETIVPGR